MLALAMFVEMKHVLFCLLLISALGFNAFAQQDSVPDFGNPDTYNKAQDEVYALINLANESMSTAPTKAMDYIGKALEKAFQIKDTRAEAFCYQTIGTINYEAKRYVVATQYFEKALPLFETNNEEQGHYLTLWITARSYDALEKYDKSLNYYNQYLEKGRDANEQDDCAEAKAAIARIYFNQGKYPESRALYDEVLNYYTSTNQEAEQMDINDALADVELAMDLDTTAINRFNQTQVMAQRVGDNQRMSRSLSNLSRAANKNDNTDQAIEYEQQALDLNWANGDLEATSQNNLNIGQTYIETNDPVKAIPYLRESINLSDELGMLEKKGEALQALTDAYEELGDFRNARKSFNEYLILSDSLKEKELEENLIALELTSGLSQRDERISLLERERLLQEQQFSILASEAKVRDAQLLRQQVISYSLGGGILVLGISAFLVYRSSRQKRRANQLLALQSLRSQMNPHFIFNSLNSVNSFIALNDERSANKYLSEFSRLMRAVMENSKHEFVPLSSELSILRMYLDLEHLRFSDKFNYTFEVDDELDADRIQIPPMLVQPYIENSIWHGLRYRKEMGQLSVKFIKNEDHLLVEIADNGIGRKQSQAIKTKNQKTTESTGMRNIEQRLQIINELHHMQLKVSIEDATNDSEHPGTRVQIAVPVKSVEQDL